jgi:polyisoprenoid-binding protein YceI
MKHLSLSMMILSTTFAASLAQAKGNAAADVALSPAGSFVAKTDEVAGEAIQEGDTVKAENIVVKLDSLKTGIPLRDKHAKDKYLETKKFPDAVLTKAIGKGGKGKGRLKIRNIEKDVEGTYKVDGGNLTANFPIKLSDYGITGIKYMGVGVDDQVKLTVTVPVKKK